MDYNKSKTAAECRRFQFLGSLIRHNDIQVKLSPGLTCPEQHSKREHILTRKLRIYFKQETVMCYTYKVYLFGANSWTLRNVDYKHLESSETWGCRKMEKIIWYDHVRSKVCIIA